MKRIAIHLSISVLTFACGFSVASVWNRSNSVENGQRKVIERSETATPIATAVSAPTPDHEVVLGRGGLKIVPKYILLKSERLQYEVDITYPQFVGTKAGHIRNLNQRIKQLATKQYQWLLTPSKEDLRYYRKVHPEVFNSLEVDYEVILATDSVLSIYFNAYSYGIGAAHAVQYSFVINYDLVSGKELKLAHLFKPHSKHLNFISRYCSDKLSLKLPSGSMFTGVLEPNDDNFESWNFTRDGLRFNFDACSISGCAGGKYEVKIPFADLKKILNTEKSLLKQLGV